MPTHGPAGNPHDLSPEELAKAGAAGPAGAPGDPGAPAMPDEVSALLDSLVPEQDLKPLADEADAVLAGEVPPGEAALEEVSEDVDAAAEVDVSPIAEKLGIDAAAAMELWEAAQTMPQTEGLTPDELADRLVDDFDLRMRIEKLAAGEADQLAQDAMVEEGLMVPEAGPAGPPAAGGPGPGDLPPGM